MINRYNNHYDKMLNLQDNNENKVFAGCALIFGYIKGLMMLDIVTTWGYIIKLLGAGVTAGVAAMAALLGKSIYKWAEPKTVYYCRIIFINIKSKISRNGKSNKNKTDKTAA